MVRVVFGAGQPGSTSNPGTGDANQRTIPGAELAPPVANLAPRTVGLCSPAAPPEGDLVPSASGWLIGTGPPRQQLYPVFSRRADHSLLAASLYVGVVGFVGLPTGALVGGVILAAPLLAVIAGIEIVPRLRLRRQFELAQRFASLDGAPSGSLVRVAGTIAPQATVPTLFRGVPAVLFRNRIANADETRGHDFLLDLDHGEQVKVAVRRSFLLEPPTRTREPPACGPVSDHVVDGRQALQSDLLVRHSVGSWKRRYESSVGPGDRVEICGIVEHVLDPALESRSPREAPIRPVLMADEKTPLLVRRV